MDLTLDLSSKKAKTKADIEKVEREKEEYKLIGTYLRTRGLRLYSYNSTKDRLLEVKITKGNTLYLIPDKNKKLRAVDLLFQKAIVDSRNIHFEALNLKNAKERIKKYKQGKIKELCNLRKPGNGINFW